MKKIEKNDEFLVSKFFGCVCLKLATIGEILMKNDEN